MQDFWLWSCRVFSYSMWTFSYSMWTLNCSMWNLVPWPGIKPRTPALGTRSLSHCTTRYVLIINFFTWVFFFSYDSPSFSFYVKIRKYASVSTSQHCDLNVLIFLLNSVWSLFVLWREKFLFFELNKTWIDANIKLKIVQNRCWPSQRCIIACEKDLFCLKIFWMFMKIYRHIFASHSG